MRVLVVDNYDSFVFNLVQYLGQLGVATEVSRNDDKALADPDAVAREFQGILISPGPGTPQQAGASVALVDACRRQGTPLLGVCLGHQAIGHAFGATVARAPELLHGKTSLVFHSDAGVFRGLPDPFVATRYHSLTVLEPTVPSELEITARTEAGIVMGVRHRELPIHGVQFHPESVLTYGGHRLLANWLVDCGHQVDEQVVRALTNEVAALVTQ